MITWLTQLCERLEDGEAAILVTVAQTKGSAPREAGARMVVCTGSTFGTIGGGELEHQAIDAARGLLAEDTNGKVLQKSLGPDLGQCCGGQVILALEPFASSDLAWVQQLLAMARTPNGVLRRLSISPTGAMTREIFEAGAMGENEAGNLHADVVDGHLSLTECIVRERQPLWIFGAGHVGQAVVQALLPLPFDITWVDSRLGVFDDLDTNIFGAVNKLVLAMPDLSVDEAPGNAFFLVMTHSHPLDEEIVSAVLTRGSPAYLGLIGSATKRARFLSRLRTRGHDRSALANIHCPIGLPELGGKSPPVIAASVAADLCRRVEQASINKPSNEYMDQRHV